MKKILIVKTSSLGDIVHSFSVIEYLKTRYRDVEIHWVVESSLSGIVKAHPNISKVIETHMREWKKNKFAYSAIKGVLAFYRELRRDHYDLTIDLQGNTKSGMITLFVKSKEKIGFGFKSTTEFLNILSTWKRYNPGLGKNIREDYLSIVQQYFSDLTPFQVNPILLSIDSKDTDIIDDILKSDKINKKNCIMVCPGAFWKNKQLEFQTLIEFLIKIHPYENYCSWILVWGTDLEREYCKKIEREFNECSLTIDKLSLATLQNLMASVKKVIAMDSLPLHLAGFAGVPTFSIFGPSSAMKYKPIGRLHKSFQGSCPYGRTFIKRCPILRTCISGACIRKATVEELVFEYCRPDPV